MCTHNQSVLEYPQSMFWIKNKKKCIPLGTPFSLIKVGLKGVHIIRTWCLDVKSSLNGAATHCNSRAKSNKAPRAFILTI